MCQSTVYLLDDEIMTDVMRVETIPDGVRLTSLFEPARVVPAVVREIDMMKHVVILEPLDATRRSAGATTGAVPSATKGAV